MAGRRPLDADERAVLDRLVDECGPRLFAYVQRVHGCYLDAEDIVAETFCRAAANMAVLRGCERPDLYLLTAARNLCRDRFRRRRPVAADAVATDCPADSPEPVDAMVDAERRREMLAAVAELPEAQREVVTLRLSLGLRFEEIASLLGAPLGTVLSRMHSAVQRLRHSLGCVHEC